MNRKCAIAFFVLIAMTSTVSAVAEDRLPLVSSCAVEFGESESMLGNLGPGNDDWAPLFFSVLPDGTIAIPDYYN